MKILEIEKDVGAELREYRHMKMMSQGELATKAGLFQQTVALIENGKSFPSLKSIVRIAKALGIDEIRINVNEVETWNLKNG